MVSWFKNLFKIPPENIRRRAPSEVPFSAFGKLAHLDKLPYIFHVAYRNAFYANIAISLTYILFYLLQIDVHFGIIQLEARKQNFALHYAESMSPVIGWVNLALIIYPLTIFYKNIDLRKELILNRRTKHYIHRQHFRALIGDTFLLIAALAVNFHSYYFLGYFESGYQGEIINDSLLAFAIYAAIASWSCAFFSFPMVAAIITYHYTLGGYVQTHRDQDEDLDEIAIEQTAKKLNERYKKTKSQ